MLITFADITSQHYLARQSTLPIGPMISFANKLPVCEINSVMITCSN